VTPDRPDVAGPNPVAAQRLLWAERDVARADQRTRAAERKLALALIRQGDAERQTLAEIGRSNALRAQLTMVYASTSWAFARPVRAFARAQRALQKLLGRAPTPPVAPPPPPAPDPVPEAAILLHERERAILDRLQGIYRS
jgi:hypothetical protein